MRHRVKPTRGRARPRTELDGRAVYGFPAGANGQPKPGDARVSIPPFLPPSQLNAEVAEAREQEIELNAERQAQLDADQETSPGAIRRAVSWVRLKLRRG